MLKLFFLTTPLLTLKIKPLGYTQPVPAYFVLCVGSYVECCIGGRRYWKR